MVSVGADEIPTVKDDHQSSLAWATAAESQRVIDEWFASVATTSAARRCLDPLLAAGSALTRLDESLEVDASGIAHDRALAAWRSAVGRYDRALNRVDHPAVLAARGGLRPVQRTSKAHG